MINYYTAYQDYYDWIMGNKNSGQIETPSSVIGPVKNRALYAEIVTKEQKRYNGEILPPIKVLLNETLASQAVDSIKDSKAVVNEVAKSVITDILNHKSTPKRFGLILKDVFSNESVLSPTRWLVYWSLDLESTFKSLMGQSNWQIEHFSKNYGFTLLQTQAILLLSSPEFRKVQVNPLLQWTMKQQDIAIDPLAEVVKWILPFNKVLLSLHYMEVLTFKF